MTYLSSSLFKLQHHSVFSNIIITRDVKTSLVDVKTSLVVVKISIVDVNISLVDVNTSLVEVKTWANEAIGSKNICPNYFFILPIRPLKLQQEIW